MLRGLFGSSARMVKTSPQDYVGVADPKMDDPISRTLGVDRMKRPPVITRDVEGEREERAKKLAILGATLADVGAGLSGNQGGSLERVQQGWRKRAAEEAAQQQYAQMQAMAAQLYGDDPEAQLLFMADPEAFVGARAERLKPRTMSGGQTYFDPATGMRMTAPIAEKMDDRFGYYDPDTGEARYSDPRGPTFEEQSQDKKRLADIDAEIKRLEIARGQLGVAQGNLGIRGREFEERKRQGGFGTPGGVGAGGNFSAMTTEQLVEALRNAR